MKKLVYILSIAIGLVMTGCAQWEDFDSLAPDTWGPVPELTVELDPVCLDADGNLIKDYLPLRITTKHATDMGYVVSDAPADLDFTSLLQGTYGNFISKVDSAGAVIEHDLSGVTPGSTYYIYAVAANAAGVQTTAVKAVGAIDVDAPQPLTNPQLTATQGGKRAVIAFNENILRDETMGAIKYQIYNIDTNEFVEEGVVADATAAASNLTVTLPATVVFADDVNYIVVLSFEEGAVTDLYGNKMAAIQGVYNVDDMAVETGYWWLVEPAPVMEGFFNEGSYLWSFALTEDGNNWYEVTSNTYFSYVGEYDMAQLDQSFAGITATRWDISDLMADVYYLASASNVTALTFPYEYEGITDMMFLFDVDNMTAPCIGALTFQTQDGGSIDLDVYFGDLDYNEQQQQVVYYNSSFVVTEGECHFNGGYPILFYEYQGQLGLVAQLDGLVITPGEAGQAARMRARSNVEFNLDLANPTIIEKGGIKKLQVTK